MNDWKKIVRISRLNPLVGDIYCLVFSICDTFDPYIIYKSQKRQKKLQFKKLWTSFFSLLVFLSLIVFLPLFRFILFFANFVTFQFAKERKKYAMWQQKNIHHATSHVQKVPLDNCILFGCCCTCVYKFKSFVVKRRKNSSKQRNDVRIQMKNAAHDIESTSTFTSRLNSYTMHFQPESMLSFGC